MTTPAFPHSSGDKSSSPERLRPRVIVCGTRTFDQRQLLFDTMDRLTKNLDNPIVLHGGGYFWVKDGKAQRKVGADVFAEEWAFSHWYTVFRFCPNFDKYKAPEAYHIRNRQMIEEAVVRRPAFCCCFWDSRSPGTKSMIDLCRKNDIRLKVVEY